MPPRHGVLVFIDGLRPDVLAEAVRAGEAPHFQQLLGENGGHGWVTSVLAPAPSITFASQASLVTGAHPNRHDVPGNQFFDRFGMHHGGKARHYAFDVGDTLEIDDAIEVFTQGLASRCLGARTLYERAGSRGQRSVVVGHMYANGADRWLPPKVDMLARLTKVPGPLRITPAAFDRHVLDMALEDLRAHGLPDILTVYFMGLDAYSHAHGPEGQRAYLQETLDPLLGELHAAVDELAPRGHPPFWVLAADHGQRAVPDDDAHAVSLRSVGPLFAAEGRDLLDYPGEGRHSDAVMAFNGSMAFVYVRQQGEGWSQPPDFQREVLPLARRFWEAHRSSAGAPPLEGAVAAVLVRDAAHAGWRSGYVALTPDGTLETLEAWFQRLPAHDHVEALPRLAGMASPLTGDIVVLLSPGSGRYFGHPLKGLHGGLSPEVSEAALMLAWPGVTPAAWQHARQQFEHAVKVRCETEGGRRPQTADVLVGLEAVMLG